MTRNNHLALRLIIYVVLTSSFITLLTSAYQLYGNYKRDIHVIEARIQEISKVHLASIAARLWVADIGELENHLMGVINLPDIEYIEIHEAGKQVLSLGKAKHDNVISREYPLIYTYKGKPIEIGQMYLEVSLDGVYQNIIDRASEIILSNAIKTFLVSAFILLIFYRLVTRHLQTLATYADNLDVDKLDSQPTLDRNNAAHKGDELDLLVQAFSTMQSTMANSIRKMQDSEAHYRRLVESSSAIPWTLDVEDMWPVYMGPQIKSVFSFPVTTWCDEGFWLSRIHEQDRDAVATTINNAVTSQRACKFDYRLNDESGDSIWVNAHLGRAYIKDGKTYMQGFMFDATEEHLLHENLRENEEFMESILNNMIDGVITIDERGVIQSFNTAAEKMFGYDASEIKEKNVSSLMTSAMGEMHDKYVSSYIESGQPNVIGIGRDLVAKRKDGSLFPMRISVTELPMLHDGKKWFIGSCVDLTEQRQQEQQLRRSQKMDALGKLTGGIAHDFNNMLNVVMGYGEILHRKLENDDLIKYVTEIQNAGKRGAALTRKLLSFSSQQATEEKETIINEVLRDDRNMLQKTLTARIALQLDLADELWPVFLDKNDLEDAILNICINAMHAMPEGGDLFLSTRNVLLQGHEARLTGLEPGEYVELSIADSGIGMDAATSTKIFDPFFSTKGEQGTGLGLCQVYGFVRRSGGTIDVTSEPGEGSRFKLYFPRFDNRGEKTTEVASDYSIDETLRGDETVLVVDDEELILHLSRDILANEGYRVICANSGREALEKLSSGGIDVMLSDIIMPGMDGYELATRVRELYPEVKIQLASGFTDDKQPDEAHAELKNKLLHKPYLAKELLARIRNLLDA